VSGTRLAVDPAHEAALAVLQVVDVDADLRSPGTSSLKWKLGVELREGGDVEVLWHDELEEALAHRLREEVGLHFVKRVRDLADGVDGPAAGVVHEVEAYRVEDVASHTRQGDQPDSAICRQTNTVLFKQPLLQIQPQMTRAEVEMVVIAESVGIETVDAEEPQLAVEPWQLIEPQVHEEHGDSETHAAAG
jgi:hypothetical protein